MLTCPNPSREKQDHQMDSQEDLLRTTYNRSHKNTEFLHLTYTYARGPFSSAPPSIVLDYSCTAHSMSCGTWPIVAINVGLEGTTRRLLRGLPRRRSRKTAGHISSLRYPHVSLDMHCCIENLWIPMGISVLAICRFLSSLKKMTNDYIITLRPCPHLDDRREP